MTEKEFKRLSDSEHQELRRVRVRLRRSAEQIMSAGGDPNLARFSLRLAGRIKEETRKKVLGQDV